INLCDLNHVLLSQERSIERRIRGLYNYLMILGYMLASTGSNHGIAALSSCTGRQGCLGNHEREYFKVSTSTHHI
ncbi:unnamed protein product, partial [Brassica rapa subsp. trilocularis]